MTSPHQDSPDARLLDRYRRASAAESLAPAPAVRDAIQAEAHRLAKQNRAAATAFDRSRPAVNQPRWRLAAAGTCAAALLAVLLIAPRYSLRPDPGALISRQVAAPAAVPAPHESNAGPPAAAPADPSPVARRYAESDATESSKAAQGAAPPDASTQRSVANAERLDAQNYAPQLQHRATRSLAAGDQAAAAPPVRTSALLAAVTSADRGQILAALDQGAAVDQADDLGRTPLLLATQSGQREIVQLLLQRGADPTIADRSGRTSVQQARLMHRTDIVNLLEAASAR